VIEQDEELELEEDQEQDEEETPDEIEPEEDEARIKAERRKDLTPFSLEEQLTFCAMHPDG
jgi:hypothetical protein